MSLRSRRGDRLREHINTLKAVESCDSSGNGTDQLAGKSHLTTSAQQQVEEETTEPTVKRRRVDREPDQCDSLICPSSKIMKESNGDTNGFDSNICVNESQSPNNNSNLSPRQTETIKIIGQFLYEKGFMASYKSLISETKVIVEDELAMDLKENILKGDWRAIQEILNSLKEAKIITEENSKSIVGEILIQKYFELLYECKYVEALICLQDMLDSFPEKYRISHSKLASLLMCSQKQFLKLSQWDSDVISSRKKLVLTVQSLVGSEVLLPPARMEYLINQALKYQQNKCKYHMLASGFTLNDISILSNHKCTISNLPTALSQIFHSTNGEVYCCKFSPNGEYLAAAGRKGFCSVYKLNSKTLQLEFYVDASKTNSNIINIIWSPNSSHFIALGSDKQSEGFVYRIDTKVHTLMLSDLDCSNTSTCDWLPDSQRFIIGSRSGQISIYNLTGDEIKTKNGCRTKSIHVLNSLNYLTIDLANRLSVHKFYKLPQNEVLKVNETVTFSVLSSNTKDQMLLLNSDSHGLQLFSVKKMNISMPKNSRNIDNYACHFQKRFIPIIKSNFVSIPSFGGPNCEFISLGDTNSGKIFLWNIKNEYPIFELAGHSKGANCVHWNPKDPGMLASAGDDGQVRIWLSKNNFNKLKNLRRSESSLNRNNAHSDQKDNHSQQ
ncbi:MAG: WD repeat-containing protein 26 [Paramarteilia canceri]